MTRRLDPDGGSGFYSASTMRSRELVQRALAGLDVPRPPVGPLAVHYCATYRGVSLRDYTLDAAVLADCVVRYYERFRPDAVWVSADTWVTAEAMGARVGFPGDQQPMAGTGDALIRQASDVDRVPPPDPAKQARCPLMIDAVRRVRAALGSEVCVVACFDQYPFSLACALLGIDRAMIAAVENRRLLEVVMTRATDYAAAYAGALAEAGADVLSGGDAPAGLLGPELYRQVALPFEREVIGRLKARFSIPVSLHICGDALPILEGMAASGADVLELDQRVDMATAARLLGPGVALWGNLDPVAVLAQGTPDTVRVATRALRDAFAATGHRRFVVSSGCTLAVETPAANLDALREAAGA